MADLFRPSKFLLAQPIWRAPETIQVRLTWIGPWLWLILYLFAMVKSDTANATVFGMAVPRPDSVLRFGLPWVPLTAISGWLIGGWIQENHRLCARHARRLFRIRIPGLGEFADVVARGLAIFACGCLGMIGLFLADLVFTQVRLTRIDHEHVWVNVQTGEESMRFITRPDDRTDDEKLLVPIVGFGIGILAAVALDIGKPD